MSPSHAGKSIFCCEVRYIRGKTRNDVIGRTEVPVALPTLHLPYLTWYFTYLQGSPAYTRTIPRQTLHDNISKHSHSNRNCYSYPPSPPVIANTVAIMPVHPSEEQAPSGIFDQIAKDPTSATGSTASDHPLHQGDDAGSGKATAQDFQSKGPAIPQSMNGKWQRAKRLCGSRQSRKKTNQVEDMPPKASKEELKARSEELNK